MSADKVAIVLLAGKESSLSPNLIDGIYKDLHKIEEFNPSVSLISPSEVKEAVAGTVSNIHDLNQLRKAVVASTHARYLLALNIESERAPVTIKASLVDTEHPGELSTLVQTGVSSDRLKDRLQSMAVVLLSLVDKGTPEVD